MGDHGGAAWPWSEEEAEALIVMRCAALAILALCGCFGRREAPSFEELYRVTVKVINPIDGSCGSGVWLSRRQIVTCWHVLSGHPVPAFLAEIHYAGRCTTARFVRCDPASDLALLEASEDAPLAADPLLADPDRSEYCVMLGHTFGLEAPTLTEGLIQEVAAEHLRFSAATHVGNSGGGVFVVRAGQWRLVTLCRAMYAYRGVGITHFGYGPSARSFRRFVQVAE